LSRIKGVSPVKVSLKLLIFGAFSMISKSNTCAPSILEAMNVCSNRAAPTPHVGFAPVVAEREAPLASKHVHLEFRELEP
jgi:hypothetical protein